MSTVASRKCTETKFNTWDGELLHMRTWLPQIPSRAPKRALILIHRGHEHSGRVQEILDELNLPDHFAFAYDGRGHGLSPGPRGYAPSFSHVVKDLEAFVEKVCREHEIEIENVTVVANSVGAVIASTWVHDYAPRIRAMVLAAPAFRVKLYVPFALEGLRLLNLVKRPAFISSYVKSKMLTHDRTESRRYDEDPLITRDISVGILLGLYDASTRLLQNAQAITCPTLILSAGRDFVVSLAAQKKFFAGLGSKKKDLKVYSDFFHGVFYELGRDLALLEARRFILDSYELEVDRSRLVQVNGNASYAAAEELRKPASLLKSIVFGTTRLFLNTFGRLSRGIQIGILHGYDSGVSLDHVYENRPAGITFLGKLIDFFYLGAIGWRGIRIRKVNLESLLSRAITQLRAEGQGIRILDVAAGPGRYLMDLIERNPSTPIQAMICDYASANIERGQEIAREKNLQRKVTHVLADAFVQQALPGGFIPNIVVISGFFELYESNAQIQKAIEAIQSRLTPGAFLIYTGQPWHPQQEFIARALTNRKGEAWVMRLRSQAELDEIFRRAGFEKSAMEIDEFGIFTVSLARQRSILGREADRGPDAVENRPHAEH